METRQPAADLPPSQQTAATGSDPSTDNGSSPGNGPAVNDQDWLDRVWGFVKRRPIVWFPLALAAVLVGGALLTSQGAAQPIGTDPITRGQPLSNPDQHLHSLAIDPHDLGTLYLGSHYGLFTSSDDGQSWPEPRGRFNKVMITSLAVQPTTGDVAFIGMEPNGGDFGDNGIYISHDQGKNFARVADPPGIKSPVNRFLIAAGGDAHRWLVVYAGVGIFETIDDGQSWSLLRALKQQDAVRAVATAGSGGQTILISGTFGLYISTDSGAHWSFSSAVRGGAWAIAVSPADPHVIYVTADSGIYRSQDGGVTFALVSPLVTASPFPTLAASYQQSGTVYAISGQQIWRTTDGGATWTTQSQLNQSNPSDLFVAPADDQHLYVGFYTPAVLIASTDGGQHWNAIAR